MKNRHVQRSWHEGVFSRSSFPLSPADSRGPMLRCHVPCTRSAPSSSPHPWPGASPHFPAPEVGRGHVTPIVQRNVSRMICVTFWLKRSGARGRRSAAHSPEVATGSHKTKWLVFLSHQLEGSPGELPNLPWNLHE